MQLLFVPAMLAILAAGLGWWQTCSERAMQAREEARQEVIRAEEAAVALTSAPGYRNSSVTTRFGRSSERKETRMRQILEAVMAEQIDQETYEEWRKEATDDLLADSLEEGGAGVPLAEVQRLVMRRVLLHLAQRTTGEVSVAMRNVASEFRKRGDEG
jgi:flagellar biosynthesis/type III secretory pathway protein FliH